MVDVPMYMLDLGDSEELLEEESVCSFGKVHQTGFV